MPGILFFSAIFPVLAGKTKIPACLINILGNCTLDQDGMPGYRGFVLFSYLQYPPF